MGELKTKIALLYKTNAEWQADKDYVPMKGEFCFCEFPKDSAGNQDVLYKVGNGVDTFENLGWGMAITPVFE